VVFAVKTIGPVCCGFELTFGGEPGITVGCAGDV